MHAKFPDHRAKIDNSAEGECVGLDAGIEKLDLECAVRDSAALANKLIEPVLVNDASAVFVDVGSMIRARRHPVYRHPETNPFSFRPGAENEMKIAGAKSVYDTAAFLVERCVLAADRPIAGQGPLIELRRFSHIDVTFVF